MLRFDNKIVFISGAGSVGEGWGNGRATATLFARQGAKVFGTDINLTAAETTAATIAAEGGVCVVQRCNMTDSADVAEAVQACIDRFGRIDVLVNNVGGSAPGDPVSMTEEVWDGQMDLNLKTVFLACKHVLPIMRAQKSGVILTISSVAAFENYPYVAYKATKAALVAFTKQIAIQNASDGVRANTILPGLMDTPMAVDTRARASNRPREEIAAERAARVPLRGKQGSAWDVANAALFLASDEAQFITGVELPVDGGALVR